MDHSHDPGLLNVDKPSGWTSRKVVDRVQRLVRPAKVGHAGTLDPMATGVLVICIGSATRLTQYIHQQPKSYRARFRFGVASDTDDVTGNLVDVAGAAPVSRQQLEDVLPEFLGPIEQVPPRYSAVHVKGQRSHALARKGIAMDIPARIVTVHELRLAAFEPPEFELDIECGSGTYIRSLGRDLGMRLNSSAVMCRLVRTAVGPFRLESAVAADGLNRHPLDDFLLPAAMAVDHLQKRFATPEEVAHVAFGRALPCLPGDRFLDREHVAVLNAIGDVVAVTEYHAANDRLIPHKVFVDSC
jgi:tRNA pseudouridine55 synthase